MRQYAKAFFVALVAVLLMTPFGGSMAEESAAVTASAVLTGEVPTEPGEITLSLTMTNHTDHAVKGLIFTNTDGSFSRLLGDLPAQRTGEISGRYTLTEQELEQGSIALRVISEDEGIEIPVPVSLRPQESTHEETGVLFTRAFSSPYADADGKVSVIYRVRNQTDAEIKSLSLTDSAGAFQASAESLDPDESLYFHQRTDVGESLISHPKLTYLDEAGVLQTRELTEKTITTAKQDLQLNFEVRRDGDNARLSLTMTNNGEVDYPDVAIYDDCNGGLISDGMALKAGDDSLVIERVSTQGNGPEERWRVEAISETGETVKLLTDTLVIGEEEVAGSYLLSLYAETQTPKINRAGYVPVTVTVTDLGTVSAYNVRVSETELGLLYTFGVIPTGEPTQHDVDVYVGQNTTLNLYIEYTDVDGHMHTVYTDPIEVTVGMDGVPPKSAADPFSLLGSLTPTRASNPGLYGTLIAVASILLIFLIFFILRSGRQQRRQREAQERSQRKRNKAANKAERGPAKEN